MSSGKESRKARTDVDCVRRLYICGERLGGEGGGGERAAHKLEGRSSEAQMAPAAHLKAGTFGCWLLTAH